MAENVNLEQLIGQLEKADMQKLAAGLKNVADNASNAQKAAAKFLTDLKSGVEEQKALADALKSGYGALIDSENEAIEAAKTRAAAIGMVVEAIDKQNVSNKGVLASLLDIQKQNNEVIKLNIKEGAELKNNLDLRSKNLDVATKLVPVINEQKMALAGFGPVLDNVVEGAETVISGFTGAAMSAGESVLDFFGLKGAATGAAGVLLSKTEAGGKVLNFLAENFKKVNLELSTVTTGFSKFTGGVMRGDAAARNLSGRIIAMQKSTRLLGGNIKNLTEAMTKMVTASRTFGMLMGTNSKQNIRMTDDLTEMSFVFSKVGLGAENFGKALDVIGNTYRKSNVIGLGKELGAELVNIGRVTGQSADMVANNFNMAMSNLAAYSLPKAREEFKKLSAISAVTGVELGEVMAVASRFDDIEATADAVGSLNAMMGGPYLNTLDLVNATESERVEMLKDMMTQSGETFNTMDRFKQKAIADAIGMDVQGASRLFMGNQKDIDSTAKSIDSQSASFRQLRKSAQDATTSISDQMASAKESMFLNNKTFKETDKLLRLANEEMMKFGDGIKEKIGNVATKVMKGFNLEIKQLGRNLEKFKDTGDFGDLIEGSLGILGKFAIMGGKGTAVFEGLDAAVEEETRTPAAPITAVPSPPAAASDASAATAGLTAATSAGYDLDKSFYDNFMAMTERVLKERPPIKVAVELDGDKVGEKVLPIAGA